MPQKVCNSINQFQFQLPIFFKDNWEKEFVREFLKEPNWI